MLSLRGQRKTSRGNEVYGCRISEFQHLSVDNFEVVRWNLPGPELVVILVNLVPTTNYYHCH